MSNCRLCDEIKHFDKSLFSGTYPNVLSQNAFFKRSNLLQVMIPIGPLWKGHLLIAPIEHKLSFGHFGKNIILELVGLINDVSNFFKTHLHQNRIIVFEHGAISLEQRGGCCLEHAHMNIIPIPDSFALLDTASKLANFVPTEIYQLENYVYRKEPYLFFKCPKEGSFAAVTYSDSFQFFRKLLTFSTPGKNWDWISEPRDDIVNEMVVLLKGL